MLSEVGTHGARIYFMLFRRLFPKRGRNVCDVLIHKMMFICPSNRHVQSWLQWTNMGSNVRGNVQYYSTTPQNIRQTVLSECHFALTISSTGVSATDIKVQRVPERILPVNKGTEEVIMVWNITISDLNFCLCSWVKAKIKSLNLKVTHDHTRFTRSICPANKSKPSRRFWCLLLDCFGVVQLKGPVRRI